MEKGIKSQLLSIPITFLVVSLFVFLGIEFYMPNGDNILRMDTRAYRTDVKDLKHHYAQLSGHNILIYEYISQVTKGNKNSTKDITRSSLKSIEIAINNIKTISTMISISQDIDLSVLIAFLDKYEAQAREAVSVSKNHPLKGLSLMHDTNQYFSRINSEYYFILDELERNQWDYFNTKLMKSRFTVYLLQLLIMGLIVISTFQCLHYARKWRMQTSAALHQIYRYSAKDFSKTSDANQEDEIGLLTKSVNDMGNVISETNTSLEKNVTQLQNEQALLQNEKVKIDTERASLAKQLLEKSQNLEELQNSMTKLQEQIGNNDIYLSNGTIAVKSMHYLSQKVKNCISSMNFMTNEIVGLQNNKNPTAAHISNISRHMIKEAKAANDQITEIQDYVDGFTQISNDILSKSKKIFDVSELITKLSDIINANSDMGVKINFDSNINLKIDHQPGLFSEVFIEMIMATLELNAKNPNIVHIDIHLAQDKDNLVMDIKDDGQLLPEEIAFYFSNPNEHNKLKALEESQKLYQIHKLITFSLSGELNYAKNETSKNEYKLKIPIKQVDTNIQASSANNSSN